MKTDPNPPEASCCEPTTAEYRLVVRICPGRAWSARISGAGAFEREFASPFELARFVAWPRPEQARSGGLR